MRVSKEKINLLNRVFPHKVIFPELTEVTKVTEVGGIMELWSAKGECRSREFARFSFVLSQSNKKARRKQKADPNHVEKIVV